MGVSPIGDKIQPNWTVWPNRNEYWDEGDFSSPGKVGGGKLNVGGLGGESLGNVLGADATGAS